MTRLYLVSCSAKKGPQPTEARELYTSLWFRHARMLAETDGDTWFILSALHGLLDPHELVAPYNLCLSEQRVAQREVWAVQVIEQLKVRAPDADECVVLAGHSYRDNLMNYLTARYPSVYVPMQTLPQGKQIQWLKHASMASAYGAKNPLALAGLHVRA